MKVVLAPNAFKECLSSPRAAAAMARGVRAVGANLGAAQVPVADGGDGTLEALVAATAGAIYCAEVQDPLGRPIRARFGMLGDGSTAVIEMAEASGLRLLAAGERNPLTTTTYGTGQLILAALDRGARRIIAGIGGSATNDGGAGMAEALGYRLLNAAGEPVGRGGQALLELARIDSSRVDPRLEGVLVRVACDVRNKMCGPEGAAAVFGPQKGATPEMVRILDDALRRLADVMQHDLRIRVSDIPGSGAAGGLGGGMCGFLGAVLDKGIDLVLEHARMREHLVGADLVITGEGSLDGQTVFGKAPVGVAKMAKERGLPVVAIAGRLREGYEALLSHGIDAVFAIGHGPADQEYFMLHAEELIAEKTEQVVRLFMAGGRLRPSAEIVPLT